MDGDCSHSKRAVRERWKSTCPELTLCNHEFLPHRVILGVGVPFHERGPSKLAIVTVIRRVLHPCSVWRTQDPEEVARDQVWGNVAVKS